MNQFKRAQVVMLPTEISMIGLNHNQLVYSNGCKTGFDSKITIKKNIIPQHLYVISDDEIKKGDWCLNISKNIIYRKNKLPMDIMWKKIVATTNTVLSRKLRIQVGDDSNYIDVKYPQPSQQFIEKYIESYNKGEIITNGLVEYPCDEILVNKIENFVFQLDKYSYSYKIIIPKEYFGKQGIDIKEFERKANEIIEQVGSNNIIDTWLEKHGNPEITKQVESEAKELCEQETLEEAAERYYENNKFKSDHPHCPISFKAGAKWQAKRMYSGEETTEIYRFINKTIDGGKDLAKGTTVSRSQAIDYAFSIALRTYEWQIKKTYSEEEIIEMFDKFSMYLPFNYEFLVKEQFKNK